MTDPYRILGESLVAAARRRQSPGGERSARSWLSGHLKATAIAAVLVLGSGAAAVAASGLLNGSPVAEPQGTPTATVGSGVSAAGGGQLLALRAADPEGGPPWGMRLVHTTRGEVCVQVGRIQDGQLGQLGIDGAFHDDGRFHPLTAGILPNYTNGYADLTCLLPGEVMLANAPTEDRNAEWGIGGEVSKTRPPVQQLRSISWGLLGPHAVSVIYRTATGLKSSPVSPGTGAFMTVEPLRRLEGPVKIAGFQSGWISGHEVGLEPSRNERFDLVSTIVYRFGSLVCSVGVLAPATGRCPAPPPTPRSAYEPTRSLHEPVRVTAVAQSHAVCSAAYLLDPCYAAAVEFKAPYAIANAGSEYDIEASSTCHNATPSSWSVERNVKRGELVRTRSLGYFNCTSIDRFEVEYRNLTPPGSSRAHHASVILGVGTLRGASR